MNNKQAYTAVTSEVFVHITKFAERSESVQERIEKWYLKPLRAMSGDQGFLVLMVLLPLYEKHLRIVEGMKDNFSDGHKVFKKMGLHLGLKEEEAYLFWNNVRNGLLHNALPDTNESFQYALQAQGKPIEKKGNWFFINPFALRDQLLKIIEPELKSWKLDRAPLPKTFDPQSW